MEEKDIKEVEENKEETTAVDETVETVSEDNKVEVDKKAPAKKNTVYVVAAMSEEDFATTVDALKNYYELSEITVNGNTGYNVHTEDESGTFDICIFHNGNTYLQIGLMNVSEDEVNTIINSVKF